MTTSHPGHPTHPLRLGAPLPPTVRFISTTAPQFAEDTREELTRAKIELLYALSQHRKAWSTMRKRAETRDALANTPGGLCAIEADPHWKKATGDVQWWRDEITAQSTAILALKAILEGDK